MKVKKTLHLDPASCTSDQAALVTEEVDRLLAEGKRVTVHIAGAKELLSLDRPPPGSAFPASTSSA